MTSFTEHITTQWTFDDWKDLISLRLSKDGAPWETFSVKFQYPTKINNGPDALLELDEPAYEVCDVCVPYTASSCISFASSLHSRQTDV